jgi:predicted HTH transcriptional regulator
MLLRLTGLDLARCSLSKLKKLKKISTIESIGSSNRIEGNKLSDKEVEQLMSRVQKKYFNKYDASLSRLAVNILELLDEHPQLTVAKAAEILNAKPDTVKKSVKNLIDKGYLLKRGSTRGAWYER